jgi:hypothetical protein
VRFPALHLAHIESGSGYTGGFDHGGIAFPSGGRLVDGIYLVTQHGRDFSFTPARYFFSYWHGVVFIVVHLICTVSIWRLRKTGDLTDDKPSA